MTAKKADFKHEVFSIISRFTGQNNIVTVNVTLIDFAEDLQVGLFLSQLIYWADRTKRSDGFFYKKDDEWYEEIRITKYAVGKAKKKLTEMGIIETKVIKANGDPTTHYKMNRERFVELFISFLRNQEKGILESTEGEVENGDSLTDITSDTTTEITTKEIYIPFSEIIDYLNSKAETKYKSTTKKTKDLITARWNEGFTLDEFYKVIDNKTSEWLFNSDMNKYLRPETLFGTKFESYLNQRTGMDVFDIKDDQLLTKGRSGRLNKRKDETSTFGGVELPF